MEYLHIDPERKLSVIDKNIYGNFSEHLGHCIYEGVYVGEDSDIPNVNGIRTDVVEALKALKLPVLRWPGGCFADEYHWKDGIGPKEERAKIVNTHWGGVTEDNSFGTHEFFELCRQVGCEPYVCGNVGSGTVREMSEWVEYMNCDSVSPMADLRRKNGHDEAFGVKYFGVGNESWGCGGMMTPEYYADEYRRYQTFCRRYGENRLFKIASGANSGDLHWTEVLMQKATRCMDGLSLHYYTVPYDWQKRGQATVFDKDSWYETLKKTLRMDSLLSEHEALMDRYDPDKKVALVVDEWGTWYDVEPGTNPGFLYQQNTIRDALVAGINLNIFNQHSDRVRMANIAQLANVLQAVVLTEGPKLVLTPTYHVFKMYAGHQDATLLPSSVSTGCVGTEEAQVPKLHQSASLAADGSVTLTICNLSADDAEDVLVDCGGRAIASFSGEIVTGAMDAYNTFDAPENVVPQEFKDGVLKDGKLCISLPGPSVVALTLKLA